MNVHYGSINIKNVGKFIVPGNNVDERKNYCRNLLNSIKGVFIPKLEGKYIKILAIGTIENYFILTVDSICDYEFDYYMVDGYIEDMLKLESYFDDSRYRPRLEKLGKMLSIKSIISNMSEDEYKTLLATLYEFMDSALDLNELEETKYEDNFNEKIYHKQLTIQNEKFDIKYNNLIKIAPYLRFYNSGNQLFDQYSLLSEFVNFQKLYSGCLITSTYWLNLSTKLYSICQEIKSIRRNK
jgi:hypothetical protein